MAASLRAVKPGERGVKPRTIIEAIKAGDRLAELMLTHERIGEAVQDADTPARDLASLTRRQLEISREVEGLRRAAAAEEADAGGEVSTAFDAEAI